MEWRSLYAIGLLSFNGKRAGKLWVKECQGASPLQYLDESKVPSATKCIARLTVERQDQENSMFSFPEGAENARDIG